ncbi:MAG: glutamine-hydrolyzing GMP synthase, partial [Gammaproteobacteria bacterium]
MTDYNPSVAKPAPEHPASGSESLGTAPVRKSSMMILDFGSQYTQLIARRVRELGVYSDVVPWDIAPDKIAAFNIKGVILSGGPETLTETSAPALPDWIDQSKMPVLGICYGMQAMVAHLGGRIERYGKSEFGPTHLKQIQESTLLRGLSDSGELLVWASHGDRIASLPPEFDSFARSDNCPIAVIQHRHRPWYGLQFHPEVTHTPSGTQILSRFLFDICKCQPNWNLENELETRIEQIRRTVGTDRVLLGLSGGVDSSVTAALLSRAIGDQLICMLVDNGLMRQGEIDNVARAMSEVNIKLHIVDASAIFLRHLRKIEDPERKRKVIGRTFIDVFEHEAEKHGQIEWLAQGTIYSDVIESARNLSDASHVIKSHHNVGGLPEVMQFKLIEPLSDLFKDEARALGSILGLSDRLLKRHPFPGPGLAVRMLGAINPKGLGILRAADAILMEELKSNGLYDKVSQAFCVLLPVNSVGVVGDSRRYAPVLAIRAVETIDFMTARFAHLPWKFIERVSTRILNNVEGLSRVVYDVSG